MDRVFNFSPGPTVLPQQVMARAQADFLDWNGTGMSVMEVSHRSPEFMDLAAQSGIGIDRGRRPLYRR